MKTTALSDILYLLTDVDDTLTTSGQLLPSTLQALYDLQRGGIKVIPVTGGCAGWCDQMIRLWPVEAVVGENGAFYMERNSAGHIQLHSWHGDVQRQCYQEQLREIAQEAIRLVPNLQLAKDQAYRLADVALDYNQDSRGVSRAELDQVVELFHRHGAHARVSSIHINTWFGEYSKLLMSQRLLSQRYGLNEHDLLAQVGYVGDAPNDEVMFAFFSHTFGVANIRPHLPFMDAHPNTLLSAIGGLGFVELAQRLLAADRHHLSPR